MGNDLSFHATEEDIYFITRLSRRGEDFPYFSNVPRGDLAASHLAYIERFISVDVTSPSEFQVACGQLWIYSFGVEDFKCLSYLVTTMTHSRLMCNTLVAPYYVMFILYNRDLHASSGPPFFCGIFVLLSIIFAL